MASNRPTKYKNFLFTPSSKEPRQTIHNRKKSLLCNRNNLSTAENNNEDFDIENHFVHGADHNAHSHLTNDIDINVSSAENNNEDFDIENHFVHGADHNAHSHLTNGIDINVSTAESNDEDFDIEDDLFEDSADPGHHLGSVNDNSVNNSSFADVDEDILKEKIFQGSSHSIGEALEDILKIYLTNNLSKKTLDEFLIFIHKYLPDDNLLPKGKYFLEKRFLRNLADIEKVKHYFCDTCDSYLGGVSVCNSCNNNCKNNYFYEFGVDSLIVNFLENRYVPPDKINITQPPSDISSSKISDVKDGAHYKKLISPYVNDEVITLIWNSDGIACSNSSTRQIWPIQGHILELPPDIRYKYCLLMGIYVGDKKPNMNIFLRPFVDRIRRINQEGGVKWTDPISKKARCARLLVPLVSADAPARAEMQNMHYSNGECGCGCCLAPGETIEVGRGFARIYKPSLLLKVDENGELFFNTVLRTQENMETHATTRYDSEIPIKHCFGIKGVSVLSLLPCFDLGTSFAQDYLHFLLEGLVKYLGNLWFGSAYSTEPWSLRAKISEIDAYLQEIYPPDFVHRLPRGIKTRAYWKAQEYRNFLLFYLLPMLKFCGIPKEYLNNMILLVSVIFNFLKEEITEEEIIDGERLLQLFCIQLEVLYPPQVLTYNAHQLLHIALIVRRFGPLWGYSTFSFESFNGLFCKSIHSSQYILEQIGNNFTYLMGYIVIKNRNNFQDHESGIHCLGKALTKEEVENLPYKDMIEEGSNVYKRVFYKNQNFSSKLYVRSARRQNYFVKFLNNSEVGYGCIQCFTEINNAISCIIELYSVIEDEYFIHETTSVKINHIIPVRSTYELVILPLSSLQEKVILIKGKNNKLPDFICIRPNKIECNL